jgi:predicted DNA repair protein MutK
MPVLLQALSAIGTAAMIWVGGGIIVHGLETLGFAAPAHALHDAAETTRHTIAVGGGIAAWLVTAAGSAVVGIIVGGLIAGAAHLVPKRH